MRKPSTKKPKVKPEVKLETKKSLRVDTDSEGRLILDELSLYKLRTFEAELRDATSNLMLKQASRESYIRSIDPKGHLHAIDAEIAQLAQVKNQAISEYSKIKDALTEALGEESSNYSLEDKTGVLTKLGKEGDLSGNS